MFLFLACFTLVTGVSEILGAQVLTSPIVTNWGTWGAFEHCPHGSKVIAVQVKTEPWDFWDSLTDDTCLNGIKFFCGDPSNHEVSGAVTSSVGEWGNWGNMTYCNGHGYLRGFTLRSEEANTPHLDESATNNLRIHCSGSDSGGIDLDGEGWGEWTNPRICDPQEYVCGLQTQVEGRQGIFGDDTALNNIRVQCCDIDISTSTHPEDNVNATNANNNNPI